MLVIALFWATSRPWGIAAGTLLMLFTIMQATVVVLVSMIKGDIDEASGTSLEPGGHAHEMSTSRYNIYSV